ncbi:GyrI-like domain-containing protein [Francisella adeliensis]|uniref:AraC family transcriptional regulator n=1 Tax=Francisella adeliensis TaxID=2007306 RepID=A0A2Z4Y161_9GAMM|nr:GyrI-like domain-containing protein [Francisella adeliensis]AXA34656.1 AraC family transcriptional regulator [Francisella adeliensis]MBK2086384.1 GyrI-like domain-containing protein [Francisella adeliensis]MBK2096599.1 GyrI-like domain-containing protein [Francisella adeliensis]QIW12900.1 GyrI-like domain-containing protein [Francisella adeliensis]QIW14776.1 GyrI-like domain-containing protein [Francisella adeliensis]
MKVVGVSTKVSNDREDLLEQAWDLFSNSEVLEYLQGKNLSQDIISVYYEYEGDCDDPYTLLIGYEVDESFETPLGLNSVVINLNHEIYKLSENVPDAIFDKWEDIWDDISRERAYIADFDRYNPKQDYAEIGVEYK